LAYGSHLDNANDRIIHKRYASGESHSNSKLIAEQVLEIKILRESGEKVKAIADKFQVSISTIEGIIYGKTYPASFKKVKP
jgi:DNA-binding NarL/FixJ family response regulator